MSSVLIVTRTKDRPELLVRALDSVDKQTFTDYRHVIVNDGGCPERLNQVLQTVPNPQRAVIHHPESLGMEAATNAALRAYRATYVVVHDDDDSWAPTFLQQAVRYLEAHPDKAGVVTNITQVFERMVGNRAERLGSRAFNPAVSRFHLADFFVANQFVPIAFVYRFEVHDSVGFYDERLRVCGDLDFHIRVLKRFEIGKLKGFLANYHIRQPGAAGALSNSVSDKAQHLHFACQVIAQNDERSWAGRVISWFRVRLLYRSMNVLYRLLFRF